MREINQTVHKNKKYRNDTHMVVCLYTNKDNNLVKKKVCRENAAK